ncbi:MAG TPA: DUF3306 domain-containing protein [Xanthobacteraceae bacterium]|jgi:hypothetical protein
MSEPENFIARWSRRKREAAEDAAATKPDAASDAAAASAHASEDQRMESEASAARSGGDLPELAFDPTRLPSLESITAESDIRAFLAPGVPLELTRAALRRVWTADPRIRDYIGLSENAWDFNAPGSMAGFGPLEMTEELRREIARMVGRGLAGEEEGRPAPTSTEPQAARPSVDISAKSFAPTAEVPTQEAQSNRGNSQNLPGLPYREEHNSEPVLQRDKVIVAAQNDRENPDNDQVVARRYHGSALPK